MKKFMRYQITATIYTDNPLSESEQLELRDTVLHTIKNNSHAQFVKIVMEEEIIRTPSSLLSEKQLINLRNWIKK